MIKTIKQCLMQVVLVMAIIWGSLPERLNAAFCAGDPVNQVDPLGLANEAPTVVDSSGLASYPPHIEDRFINFNVPEDLIYYAPVPSEAGMRQADAHAAVVLLGAFGPPAALSVLETYSAVNAWTAMKITLGQGRGYVSLRWLLGFTVVAAKTGMNIADGSKELIANSADDVLLGVVENGNVRLFKSAAGQIEGHSDLLKQRLISSDEQGFSIGVKNGQVISIFRRSILNPKLTDWLLPVEKTKRILKELGAEGAEIYPRP